MHRMETTEPSASFSVAAAPPTTWNQGPTSAPPGAQTAPRQRHRHWRGRNERARLAEQAPPTAGSQPGARQDAPGPATRGGRAPRPSHNHPQPSGQEKVAVVIRGADGKAYRRSVQCFFINEHGSVLLFTPVGPCNAGFRQTVQGGADAGESPQDTARREAWEETGLRLDTCATFVCEVLPSDELTAAAASAAPAEARNDKNEIVCERRKLFRYRSKTWVKQGIFGQELYPLLYFLPSEAIQGVQVHASCRDCWTEFKAVEWGPLRDAADRAPSTKKVVMDVICTAVAAAARPYLEARGFALDGLQGLLGESEPAGAAPSAA